MRTWEIRPARPGDFEAMMRLQGKPMQGPIRVAITREPNHEAVAEQPHGNRFVLDGEIADANHFLRAC